MWPIHVTAAGLSPGPASVSFQLLTKYLFVCLTKGKTMLADQGSSHEHQVCEYFIDTNTHKKNIFWHLVSMTTMKTTTKPQK